MRRSTVTDRLRLAARQAHPVAVPTRHVLVVAPHPDDETLATGGLVHEAGRAGCVVEVVAVTDGGNAYPGAVEHDDLATVRRAEQVAAVRTLGVAHPIERLGIVDGCAPESEDDIAAALTVLGGDGCLIVAPWEHDVHSDHEAVGRAAVRAASATGRELWSWLFWAWHDDALDLSGLDLVRVDLSATTLGVKQRALGCHRSQMSLDHDQPILASTNLTPATWGCEIFVRRDFRNQT